MKRQARNRTSNRNIDINGETHSLVEWCEIQIGHFFLADVASHHSSQQVVDLAEHRRIRRLLDSDHKFALVEYVGSAAGTYHERRIVSFHPGIQFGFGPAVESGFFYDVMPAEGQVISENDFAKIEAKMMELAKKNEPVVRKEVAKADALAEFKADGQNYKCEHIEQDLEDGTITTYTQGNFTDLCRGPHLMNTGLIKAVKITGCSMNSTSRRFSRYTLWAR